jgi:Ca2+-binding RTX toxin-like protein
MADIFGDDNSNDILTPFNDAPDNVFGLGGDDFIRVHEDGGNDNVDGGAGSDTLIATNSGTLGVSVALGDRGILGQHDSYFLSGSLTDSGTLTSIENAVGGFGSDILFGNSGNNLLHGGPAGDDYLEGGLGADQLQGFDGIDTAGYSFAAASVFVFLNAPEINGGEAAGDTFLSIENLDGSSFGDLLSGDANGNKLTGNGGNDFLAGNGGSDVLVGWTGDDVLAGGSGTDAMDGGDGADTASYELATAGVRVDFALPATSTGFAVGDTYSSVENIRGSFFDDTLLGNGLANAINGDDGNDQLFGRGGDDVFLGGNGADTISGGAGVDTVDYSIVGAGAVRADLLSPASNTGLAAGDTYVSVEVLLGSSFADTLVGDNVVNRLDGRAGNDKLFGNGGSDTLVGGAGGDGLNGGTGIDTADYSSSATGLVVDLASAALNTGEAHGDTFVAIENLTGSAFFDNLRGNAGSNRLDGGGDQDTLLGRAGTDALYGGESDDVLEGGSGADVLDGGAGFDLAQYLSAAAGVVVDLLDAQSANVGDAAGDIYVSIEDIDGSAFGDVLRGDDNANRIHDGAGGNDTLVGRGGNDSLTGTAGNDMLDGGEGGDSLQGGAGIDIASYAGASEAVRASLLAPGSNAGEAFGDSYTLIESLLGSVFGDVLEGNDLTNRVDGAAGDDVLSGRGGNDTLAGGAGLDTLVGGLGVDTMIGGLGNDVYEVDHPADIVTEALNEGIDLVNSSASYTLGLNVERLTLTGLAAINGTGNALANTLTGNTAANVLNGAGGADLMIGGGGNDVFLVDNAGDVVVVPSGGADAGDGTDRVIASVSYALTAGAIEQLTTSNSSATTAINLTGNAAVNAITGNAGTNILDGKGGADTMRGLLGNDTYVVDNAGDMVVEAAGQGTDTVSSAITATLAGNVENLVLTGVASINGTGNTLANSISGNAGHNLLNGLAGNDKMTGGAGNDTYVVDAAGDAVVETIGQGIDTVNSSVSKLLAANVENLVLTGILNIAGTGNTLANTLSGNAGSNTLDGAAGNDTMKGGLGNDIYVVDAVADAVIELAAQGTDTVRSAISETLSVNVENLLLTGVANSNGTGNALANVVTGNAGANVLDGKAGKDVLTGGGGKDAFLFSTALSGTTNVDVVTDFSVPDDTIRLENAVFTTLVAGALPGAAFFIGASAHDASDRIIYNSATGALIYDTNGSALGGAVQFATLDRGLALTSADFLVV